MIVLVWRVNTPIHSLPICNMPIKYVYCKHLTKSMFPHPSNRDCNFQIICHITNSITLLGVEFNNAHSDNPFASIDPKIMKLRPIEGIYHGIFKRH